MDIPQPPPDEETRNIIDRLANFVARNGQDFENMTKQKQRDNPKFQFLFGGEYYGYYTYRVTTEQAILKQQNMRQQQFPIQQQQTSLMGNPPSFQNPNQSRFTLPIQQQQQQHFDRQSNPGSGPVPLMAQRFDNRTQFQYQQRMNFDNRLPGNNFQSFDRQPSPHSSNFSGHNNNNHAHPMQIQQFQRPQSSSFDNFPNQGGGPSRFDRQTPHSLIQQSPGMRLPQQQQQIPISSPQVLHQQQIPLVNIESLLTQKKSLEEQITQSEKNLAAQQQVLQTQQQIQIEEALRKVQDAEIGELSQELNINITEFGILLQQVMDTCTKESIANGKAWIFNHNPSRRYFDLINTYLLRRITDPGTSFLQRLHLIYLVNDSLHHCSRKGAEDIQMALERTVIPMFCFTKFTEGDNDENIGKLNKLLSLWESKSNYISKTAVDKLNNFTQAWADYKHELVTKHAVIVTQIASSIQKTFEGYQAQHLLFVQHVTQSMKQIEQKIEDGLLQQQKMKLQDEEMRLQQEKFRIQQEQIRHQEELQLQQQQLIREQQSLLNPNHQMGIPQPLMSQNLGLVQVQTTGFAYGGGGVGTNSQDIGGIPDLSRPPPGFGDQHDVPPSIPEIPRLPYYELPAGLMVPLIKPEDDNYKAIDPSLIRLPPPCPPSDRLLQAIEAFYGPPSHDNPRDSEGWERLGLYEFYKSKNLARKQKEDDIREGRREKSKSPSPIRREQSPSGRSPPRKRYQSKSPSPIKRRRSRSRSPRQRRRRRSRSRSRSPMRRSPTPPSFGGGMGLGMERSLDESNKGHQLLKKMGWIGSGLGANEQGIEAPVKGGEIRDRVDQYKGVGVNLNDPFESYRKSKGQAFVERMRARADERP